jgi:hypothetical protein
MKVRAKRFSNDNEPPRVVGYFGNKRIREGEVFDIGEEVEELEEVVNGRPTGKKKTIHNFSDRWMERIDVEPIERKPVGRPKGSVNKPSGDVDVI